MSFSLVVLTEAVSVSRIVTLAWIPHVVRMHLLVWVLLDSEVCITGKEEAING